MKCPYCGAEESKVIDSRPTEDSERIRRFRIIWITRNITTSERFNYISLRDSHSSVST